jgi:hypothetical protein
MKMKLVFIAMLLLTSVAYAQKKPTFVVGQVRQQYDDSTDVGKAMNICAMHRHAVPSDGVTGGVVIEYDNAWESCNVIHEKWEKSDEAKNKAFVDKVAQ